MCYDSLIKWQLSEQAVEDYAKGNEAVIRNFVRHEPTGVKSPNVDFSFTIANEHFLVELKNHLHPLTSEFVKENILPKFYESQSKTKTNSKWVIVVPRIYSPAKQVCIQNGITVVEFEKQTLTKELWESYSPKNREHSSPNIVLLFNSLDSYFFGDGSKVVQGKIAIEFRIRSLTEGNLIIEDERGDYLFVMIGNKIDPSIPFMTKLKICDICGNLYQAEYEEKKFCSMKCYHASRRRVN